VALTMAIGVAPLQAKPIDIEALIAFESHSLRQFFT
jgi:hypothetical protein